MAEAQGAASKSKYQAGRYIPRKCSWTHKMLPASDRGSTQVNIAVLDSRGVARKV